MDALDEQGSFVLTIIFKLSQAYATREDFAQQRTMLTGVNSRMTGVLSESGTARFKSSAT